MLHRGRHRLSHKRSRILAVLLALGLTSVVLYIALPVEAAAPGLSASVSDAQVRTTFTVTFTGAVRCSQLQLQLDGRVIDAAFAANTPTSETVPTDAAVGATTLDLYCILGLVPPTLLGTVPFTVDPPTMTLSPATGPPGSPFTITTQGFPGNCDTVAFYWDFVDPSTLLAPADPPAPPDGNQTTVDVPVNASGLSGASHQVVATYCGNTVAVAFAVLPTLVLTPAEGLVGDTFTGAGVGYAGCRRFTLQWDTPAVSSTGTIVVGGNSASDVLTVPVGATVGPHTVTSVCATVGPVTTAVFTVRAPATTTTSTTSTSTTSTSTTSTSTTSTSTTSTSTSTTTSSTTSPSTTTSTTSPSTTSTTLPPRLPTTTTTTTTSTSTTSTTVAKPTTTATTAPSTTIPAQIPSTTLPPETQPPPTAPPPTAPPPTGPPPTAPPATIPPATIFVPPTTTTLAPTTVVPTQPTTPTTVEAPPPSRSLSLSEPAAPPGGTVEAVGHGCRPGATVSISLDGRPAGTTTADGAGEFHAPVALSEVVVGRHQVLADCGIVLTAPLDVVLATSVDGGTSTLAVILFFLAIGLALYRRASSGPAR